MLENKVIVILGATGGIGSAVAEKASKLGAKLVLVARNLADLKELENSLQHSISIQADVTNSNDLKRMVEEVESKFGKIDVLIHAVGSIVLKPIHVLKIEEFEEIIKINLTSAFLAIKAVIRGMIRNKSGSIIVISSVAGSKGLRNHEAISAAKGGLESMIRSAANTYASKGIRFNGVALGLVDTPLAAGAKLTTNEKALEISNKMHPLGRIGKPEDIVYAILYLASDNSSWVTGAILPIDGGLSVN
ncbi:MAG: SDR family oxidoreductase [Candidatus Lokiarchaeota archaeon]|nr:SDR family oxidoreductase [Candidatus Lokiarchaeota archaeon]